MMGRGADGGCVGNGNLCPIHQTENCAKITCQEGACASNSIADRMGIDVVAQALKALALKPPFDADDGCAMASDGGGASQFGSGGAGVGVGTGAGGDGRRKHRKVQGRGHEPYTAATFGGSKKNRDGKTSKIWLETEEYFREVTSEDIEALIPQTKIDFSDWTNVCDPCLLLPRIRGSLKDETNALQNSNYATLGKVESQDIDFFPLAQSGPDLASNKQQMPTELRMDVEPLEHGLESVLIAQELSSSAKLTDILPVRQDSASATSQALAVSSPMEVCQPNHAEKTSTSLEMNSIARVVNVMSVPVHELYPPAQSEVAKDIRRDLCSSATVSTPEHEPGLDTKFATVLSCSKPESVSEAKLAVMQESSSIPNCALSPKKERRSDAKRKLLAATFCSKKRKISESSAEMMTTVVSPPENGDEEHCDVCCSGDSDEWNQILSCVVCEASVHQECYGVQMIPNGQWLCSWCSYQSQVQLMDENSAKPGNNLVSPKHSNGGLDNDTRPCILCTRSGGALKPVARPSSDRYSNGYLQFAHLFCCQWIPETYVENTETMEPIKNVEGIMGERWKLLCSLCKENHGACIQCSHGNCETVFHPRCAREIKLWMGISSKEGSGDIDLWAFCPKHSVSRVDGTSFTRIMSNVGSSEAEFMLSGETNTSHYSNEICLGQESQLPPMAGRFQNVHSQFISKDVSCNAMEDKCSLSGNLQGIKDKISDVDSAVIDLALGNSENTIPENSVQVKRIPILQDVKTNAECNAVSKFGAQDVGASILLSESKENALNVEADNYDCNENLRKVERHEILTDLENGMCVSPNWPTSLIKEAEQLADSVSTKLKCQSESLHAEMEDVPEGIGDSAVEKNSNSKHASLKIQAKLTDCKELTQLKNNKAVSSNLLLKGRTTREDLDAVMDGSNSGLIFEGDRAEIPLTLDIESVKKSPNYYVHPYIQRRLLEFQNGLGFQKGDQGMNHDGHPESKAAAGKSCFHGTKNTDYGMGPTSSMSNVESISKDYQRKQVIGARNKGVSNLAPENELESEILFLQSSLLDYAWINRKHIEDLLFRVITNLSKDQQALRKQKADRVVVNEYLRREREAKKQGRKERRHKEAQAILAAATAAAAASPRIGSSRKDGLGDAVEEHGLRQVIFPSRPLQPDEWGTRPSFSMAQPMKVSQQKYLKGNIVAGIPGSSSQTILRAKETLSRPIVAKFSSEKQFDSYSLSAGSLQNESLLCDICRLQNGNKIYTCRHCKVSVHQDCYGLSPVHSSTWYCQPCEELNWKYHGSRFLSSQGRPGYDLECALCGGPSGAFKITTTGQWVHVFCAEWILENTFKKGQIEPIAGMEFLSRERPISACSICHRQGVCLKCNFGHCHNYFHPLCARDSGLYMTVGVHGGRVQHKAYCEKHSSEQKLKVDSRKHGGAGELKLIKQMRVELERIRLICERTVRREKLKREVLHCSHNILASKRDCVAFSAVFHSSFLPPDVSSHADFAQGSIVTSFRGLPDESKSWKASSIEKRRFDGYGVDTGSGNVREVVPGRSELNHQMITSDDIFRGRNFGDSFALVGESGRSRKLFTYSPQFGASDDREDAQRRTKKSRKIAETLQREMVMTPTEASMQNKRLPKGYAYVPLLDLQNAGPQDS
ncbi:hypothetical protein SUGI_0826580 [Cryptomeria japonica]|uniref:uncharacterized protein LOC131035885 isoform X2 n=1 Tax=Cryptomeria japonica TaxID=3369 RepID=UPI002414CD41|nr:uncharacterized protein LOC131035885 isoform X2 [Cryptomeria japonica]GLJ40250.1 hypothetical protein SUGI_0826580 [Cryptomeria japonica]